MAEEELNKIREDEEVATTEQEDDSSLGWGETIDAEGEVYVSPEELARQKKEEETAKRKAGFKIYARKRKLRLALHIAIPSFFIIILAVLVGLFFASFTLPDKNGLYYELDGKEFYIRAYNEKEITESLTIPSTHYGLPVTAIENNAFEDCRWLTSVTIPNSVTSIGVNSFANCTELTSLNIPNGVISIEYRAFSGCSNLTDITIPESVSSIKGYAFANCNSLTSINIPISMTSIGERAFIDCFALTSITIPDSITSIDNSAFYGCSSLTTITIPSEMTTINHNSFMNCTSLTSITIPASITSIENGAFSNCLELTDIYYEGTMEQWNAIMKGVGWNAYTGDYTVHCSDGDLAKE